MKTARMLLILVLALGLSAEVANADFTFGTPTNLGPTVNSSSGESDPHISSDGLSLHFASTRPGGSGGWDIWVTTRASVSDPWGQPVNLGPTVNTSRGDSGPNISADGLLLFFESNRSGGSGDFDVWVTTRPTKDNEWGTPVNLGPMVNSSAHESGVRISPDGLAVYFTSNQPGGYGGYDMWVTTRATKADDWSPSVNLGPTVNSSSNDITTSISVDGLMLFFSSNRPGGSGGRDIWVTTRPTIEDPWETPLNPGPPLNTAYGECNPSISADGLTLYFDDWTGPRPGGVGSYDLWQVSIIPIVDFNGDGIVDSADMCIMVDYWGTDEPLCDIGPMPWGDGIVDVQDLIVLSEYLFEELNDPTLVAHWALDEIEGDIASDSTGDKAGLLFGGPVWRPAEGKRDGALEFDGIDDYIGTDFVLDPADGAFSVLAWIKGGAAGQVVISQTDGTGTGETWLGTELSDGKLMTGLVPPAGRSPSPPLVSESMITDGYWHHIGFVWDGSHRYLYVDGAEVAKDTKALASLTISDGGLYIGAGKMLDASSFFSGLIDDVRIYNQALSAERIEALAR